MTEPVRRELRLHPPLEPIVRDGKIREQIELENRGRREYMKKWGFMVQPEATDFYNLKKNNQKLREMQLARGQNVNLHEYNGHGESYFVSRQMFKTLLDTCRCGRKRTNTHALKCLQKAKSTYEKTDDEDEDDDGDTDRNSRASSKDKHGRSYIPKVPTLSSGMYGWPHNRFVAMEKTTYYVSPRYTMPGHKVVDCQPYNNIILG